MLVDLLIEFIQSSIANRFSKDKFHAEYNQTLGIDYHMKRINLTRQFSQHDPDAPTSSSFPLTTISGSYNVTLAVNDVGGQTLGGAMLDKYIYGADVSVSRVDRDPRYLLLMQIVLLVYDITNYQSFENLEDWYRSVLNYCAGRKPFFALVGNKSK